MWQLSNISKPKVLKGRDAPETIIALHCLPDLLQIGNKLFFDSYLFSLNNNYMGSLWAI